MGKLAKTFGILHLINVELPARDAAEQARFDETNAELAGTDFRTGRFAYDWGFCSFAELQKKGILKRQGSKRKGTWIINE